MRAGQTRGSTEPTRRAEGIDPAYGLGRIGNFDSFGGLPIPWEQAFQLVALCASGHDALEHVGQPCQRIDAVKLASLKEADDDSPMPGATICASKEVVASSKSDGPHGALNGVRVQFQTAIIKEANQSFPVAKRISDRLGQFGAARDAVKLLRQPGMHRLDNRSTTTDRSSDTVPGNCAGRRSNRGATC